MIKFAFSRRDSSPPHGFELGDIVVDGSEGVADSRGHVPDRGMMVYVTLVALVDGARKLLEAKGRHSFELVGTGSSFSLVFLTNPKTSSIHVRSNGNIGSAKYSDFKAAVWDAATEFVDANPLETTDPVHDDLANALRRVNPRP